ncbi:hypothetical protein BJ944DRAFT_248473 [Cunninghamella echinulata]|nr:hypothetical protein BJ944DRAFT_248473 [Cunninghamella echinulata]
MSNILPLFDPELDISSLNVFQTFQIQPYEHQLIDRSSKSNGTTIQNNNNNNKSNNNIPLNSTKNNTTPTKDNNNDLYCKACKKKFNNEATMQNHLKSAKHVAAVKKASGGAGGKKSTKQPVVKDENQKNEIKNPATAEALQKLEAISKLNHASAVVSYMDLSKEFYLQKHPLYTAMSLLEIIKLKQNDDIHWKARLYLARLYCIYDKSMEMAYDQYLLILEERHYINKQTLLNLAQSLDKMSIDTLINKCEQLIGQSKELPLSLSFLEESAHAFAQINTTVTGIHNLSEKFSILLYILAYKIQEDKQRCYSYCSMISMVKFDVSVR